MAEEKKEKFREQFKDWVQRTTDRRIDTLSQTDASRLMSRFFVGEAVSRLMPGIVPEDESELQNSVVDGANDSGVDFLYRSDGHVLMVQAKLRARDRDEDASALGRFLDSPQRLHQAIMTKGHNLSSQLRELVSEIEWETDAFHLFYITTNNTQNSIKVADFRSNDAVQKDLATRFYALYRGGKRFAYKNKRSPSRGGELTISLEDFAKTIHSFDYGPDDVAGGTRYLFDTSIKGGYRKIFGDPDQPFDDAEFKLAAGTYFLCEKVKEIWDAERSDLKKGAGALRPALERKWLIYYVMGALLRAIYTKLGANLAQDVRRLYKPNSWMDGENPAVIDIIQRTYGIAADVAMQSYELRAADQDKFRHRNWFRSEQTLLDLEKSIDLTLKFQASLDQFRLFRQAS